MQGTRKKAAKNRMVRIPVKKLLKEDEWLSITNVNCYSEYEYSQFVKIVVRELFFYITKTLNIKVGFPKIITSVNKEVVGRWECTTYNHLWWVPFIKKEYTWRWWYTKLDFRPSKLFYSLEVRLQVPYTVLHSVARDSTRLYDGSQHSRSDDAWSGLSILYAEVQQDNEKQWITNCNIRWNIY